MGPYAVVDYNLTLSRLQSRLQHIYHGQPCARTDLTLRHSRLYSPIRDLEFGLRALFLPSLQGCPFQISCQRVLQEAYMTGHPCSYYFKGLGHEIEFI
jgi:hypothetical protein